MSDQSERYNARSHGSVLSAQLETGTEVYAIKEIPISY